MRLQTADYLRHDTQHVLGIYWCCGLLLCEKNIHQHTNKPSNERASQHTYIRKLTHGLIERKTKHSLAPRCKSHNFFSYTLTRISSHKIMDVLCTYLMLFSFLHASYYLYRYLRLYSLSSISFSFGMDNNNEWRWRRQTTIYILLHLDLAQTVWSKFTWCRTYILSFTTCWTTMPFAGLSVAAIGYVRLLRGFGKRNHLWVLLFIEQFFLFLFLRISVFFSRSSFHLRF